ncbi:MAG: hypothetical protein ACI4LX_06915 [Treponema sp.]
MAQTIQTQREYKDRLFKAIFGRNTPESKKWRLELYNFLNGTNYTDPDALELNTIENVIYITMHNDISFLVDSEMNLYEQQTTHNPNMPLRGLLYFSQLYQIYLTKNGKNLVSSRLVKIPTPKFIVFYTGSDSEKDKWQLKLSSSFINEDNSGDFEWTAMVYNLNPKYSGSTKKGCKPLYDYVQYVYRIKENQKAQMPRKNAINEAVDYAISQNFLDGYFKKWKEEIIGMSLTEYNEAECIRTWQDDGKEEGIAIGIARGAEQKAIETARKLLADGKYTVNQIADLLQIPVEAFCDPSSYPST